MSPADSFVDSEPIFTFGVKSGPLSSFRAVWIFLMLLFGDHAHKFDFYVFEIKESWSSLLKLHSGLLTRNAHSQNCDSKRAHRAKWN